MRRHAWMIGVVMGLAVALGFGMQDAAAQAKLTLTIRGQITTGTHDLFKQMAAKVARGTPAQKAIDEAVAEMKKTYAASGR